MERCPPSNHRPQVISLKNNESNLSRNDNPLKEMGDFFLNPRGIWAGLKSVRQHSIKHFVMFVSFLANRYLSDKEVYDRFEAEDGFRAYLRHVVRNELEEIAKEFGVSKRTALDYIYALRKLLDILTLSYSSKAHQKTFRAMAIFYAFHKYRKRKDN